MASGRLAVGIGKLILQIGRGIVAIERKAAENAEASRISAQVLNLSSTEFDVTFYKANHGKKHSKGVGDLASVTSTAHHCEEEAKKALGKDADEETINKWVLKHIETHKDKIDDNILEFSGEGLNLGTELAAILTEKNDPDSRIVLLIRKRPGGDYGAGISMSNGSWFTDSGYDRASDDDGSEISAHIQEVSTDLCKFSHGDPTGPSISTKFNGIKVTTNAEKVAQFVISDVS